MQYEGIGDCLDEATDAAVTALLNSILLKLDQVRTRPLDSLYQRWRMT